jgi:ATP-dependent Lon protease
MQAPGALRAWNAPGLVGNWDCVTFDEVAGMHFKDANAVQILKGYMAGGTYARGRESFAGDASMVFEGNINDSAQNIPQDNAPVRSVPS